MIFIKKPNIWAIVKKKTRQKKKISHMILARIISWVAGDIRFISPQNSLLIVQQGDMVQWIKHSVGKCFRVTGASAGPPTGRRAASLKPLSPLYSTGPCCPV